MKHTFNSKSEIPVHIIKNGKGLEVEFYVSNAAVRRIGLKDIMANLDMAHPIEGGISNIYLRILKKGDIVFTPFFGPDGNSLFSFGRNTVRWKGSFAGLSYEVCFTVSRETNAWFYNVHVRNESPRNVEFDLVYIQDRGISNECTIRINEAYTSQYIDQKVFNTPKYGAIIASRQNNPFKERCPWMMDGCLDGSSGYLTDGIQFYGLTYKDTNIPEALLKKNWKNEVLQDEFSIGALKSTPYILRPGQVKRVRYFAFIEEDHKKATNAGDLKLLKDVGALFEKADRDIARGGKWAAAEKSVFNNIRFFETAALSNTELDKYFGRKRKHLEISGGRIFSFFTDRSHVATKDKETILSRPHGNIIRSGKEIYPRADVLAGANYMYGGFNLHLTIGNTSFDQLLSHPRSFLNIMKASGQRIFIGEGSNYEMLGLPSAYEMGITFARWIYKGKRRVVEIKVWADPDNPEVYLEGKILKGEKAEFLVSHEITLGSAEFEQRGCLSFDSKRSLILATPAKDSFLGIKRPGAKFFILAGKDKIAKIGMDELLYSSGGNHNLPYAVIKTKTVDSFKIAIGGSVESRAEADKMIRALDLDCISFDKDIKESLCYWKNILRGAHLTLPKGSKTDRNNIEKINEILPWYLHNAGIHFTVPFGLEQYKGAAWGVRDVLQGPVEAFLPLRHSDAVREMLIKVFSAQYIETGNWPQWFMFDVYKEVQETESHGDIIIWPFKAVSEYIEATGDFSILDEEAPYTRHDDPKKSYTEEKEPVWRHLMRVVDYIKAHLIPGTYLSIYGGGDWDDTLQPANKKLRERMASGWTVLITYQYLKSFSEILHKAEKFEEAEVVAGLVRNIKSDYHKYIMKDGIASGFIYIGKTGRVDYMLHPRDKRTRIKYRLLPMTRGMISEMFSKDEMARHYGIILENLDCPDGPRLMNKAVPYSGGPNRWFRRAEMAAYFGREIGLMYVHAALRYAEALAKIGEADRLFSTLLKAVPINIKESVSNALTRQANAYFSSSDGDFKTRYEVDFPKLKIGKVPVKGGWRIYSSGPGLFIRQIINNFLGIRFSFGDIVVDPVLPARMDGLEYLFDYKNGKMIRCIYRTGGKNSIGVSKITLNGKELAAEPVHNPYRQAGVRIPLAVFEKRLKSGVNILVITLSSNSSSL